MIDQPYFISENKLHKMLKEDIDYVKYPHLKPKKVIIRKSRPSIANNVDLAEISKIAKKIHIY